MLSPKKRKEDGSSYILTRYRLPALFKAITIIAVTLKVFIYALFLNEAFGYLRNGNFNDLMKHVTDEV